jgi:hypothetical protein
MWESQAAFERDFSKPLREATLFVAFRGGVISIANRFCFEMVRQWRGSDPLCVVHSGD